MVSIRTTVVVLSCGLLLSLGAFNTAQALAVSTADSLNAEQTDRRQGGQEAGEKQMNKVADDQSVGERTVKGEVLGIEVDKDKEVIAKGQDMTEPSYIIVKARDGEEVRLHVDVNTQQAKNIVIERGDQIEAQVNGQNHAMSIFSGPAIQDRRNAKE
jgi:hypothetical protein